MAVVPFMLDEEYVQDSAICRRCRTSLLSTVGTDATIAVPWPVILVLCDTKVPYNYMN